MLKNLLPRTKKDEKDKDCAKIKSKHDDNRRTIPRSIIDLHENVHSTQFEPPVSKRHRQIMTHYDNYIPIDSEALNIIETNTTSQFYLPFGDGSNKVFGYENFGNTCYCNSILQCLFYLDTFRINILTSTVHKNLPSPKALTNNNNNNTPTNKNQLLTRNNNNSNYNISLKRHRKRVMNGTKKRYFTMDSFQPTVKKNTTKNAPLIQETVNNTPNNDNNNKKNVVRNNISDNITERSQRRSSSFTAFSRPKKNYVLASETCYSNSANGKVSNDAENNEVEIPIEPHHTIVMASDCNTEKLHDGCERIIVGRKDYFSLNNNNNNNNTSSRSSASQHSSSAASFMLPASSLEPPPLTPSGSCLHMEDSSLDPVRSSLTSNSASNNDNNNNTSLLNTFTSEKRKKSALIEGPILNIDYMVNVTAKQNIYNGLKDIFECITENDRLTGIVSPVQFMHILKKENILFNTSSQQDAHEFLNFILNDINEYFQAFNDSKTTNSLSSDVRNFVLCQFQGVMTNKTRCLTCDTETCNDEPFLDFPIEMSNEENSIDIQDFLNDYNQTEFLRGSNKFYCNQCSSLQEAERVVSITALPPTLALHLKRFKYSEELQTNVKLFNKVHYPLILDVSSNMDYEHKVYGRYELTSVVVHMGNSPQHGHYVSLCKSSLYGWLLFDDETVESVSENTVLKFIGDEKDQSTAYVLFYKELVENNVSKTSEVNLKPQNLISVSDIIPKNKNEYEERIDHLIKTDDHLKELQQEQMQQLNQLSNKNGSSTTSFPKSSNTYASETTNSSLPLRNKSGRITSLDKKEKRRSKLMTFIMK